ncbi:hypothetical protein Acid345_1876 [Candidatus Koribacter versatilis Ellin345]|uniref:Uncharacterized protein n=1 Tax=Koribacter versatilis (strain Ellin345) TaxID=204669 RepID=Q1IQH3_KORVE|nr:hypothetical protein [Candidatus Koribacter versatilis]ABF40877.1 hypothetical protein Acid345_1876 [Candidatus Koribacter versatilis Ellin345]
MNREKMVLGSVVFLALGIAWITSFWNGSMGFNAAHPIAGSSFAMNVTVTGWPALGGVTLTALGAVLLVVAAVLCVVDIATAKRA